MKIENRDISEAEVEESLKTARIVYGLGIPTPAPGSPIHRFAPLTYGEERDALFVRYGA